MLQFFVFEQIYWIFQIWFAKYMKSVDFVSHRFLYFLNLLFTIGLLSAPALVPAYWPPDCCVWCPSTDARSPPGWSSRWPPEPDIGDRFSTAAGKLEWTPGITRKGWSPAAGSASRHGPGWIRMHSDVSHRRYEAHRYPNERLLGWNFGDW